MRLTIIASGKIALSFIIVSISAQCWPTLPAIPLMFLVFALGLLLIMRYRQNTYVPYILGAFVGMLWMASVGHSYQLWQLPSAKIKKTTIADAWVLKYTSHRGVDKLLLNVVTLDGEKVNFNAKVNHYFPSQVYQKHQKVRLCLSLKPARGLQNPGGFDYWRWLVSKQIKTTGYVKKCDSNALLQPAKNLPTLLRYRINQAQPKAHKWLNAMLMADRDELQQQDWQMMQRTGVAHLFTLSGLHMGMVYVVFWGLAKLLVFASQPVLRIFSVLNLDKLSQLLALLFSWGFVVLCDSPLTLVRAALALSLVVYLKLSNQFCSLSQGFILIFAVCLLIFPFSIFGLSVYLSFFAVAVLLYWHWRFHSPVNTFVAKLKYALTLQFALSGFMAIASSVAFGAVHWTSFLVNLVAIPVVTFVIVPMGCISLLTMAFIPSLGALLIQWLGLLMHGFINVLVSVPTMSSSIRLPLSYAVLIVLVCVLGVLPSIRFRRLNVIVLFVSISVVLSRHPITSRTQWQIHVFDVGQGSAVLLHSLGESMLVDTGGGIPGQASMAELIVAPAIANMNIVTPMLGVISHFDKDHAAGKDYLTENGYISHWRSTQNGCVAGDEWWVGSLQVTVLWPDIEQLNIAKLSKNNLSCVLMVSDGQTRVLIPGDIEKYAEQKLLEQNIQLEADILIAPHHGSNTSSTPPWVRAVAARYVVFTNGFMNRWGFPHSEVLRRYRATDARLMTTAEQGYIRFDINRNAAASAEITVQTYSSDLKRLWYKSQ